MPGTTSGPAGVGVEVRIGLITGLTAPFITPLNGLIGVTLSISRDDGFGAEAWGYGVQVLGLRLIS